ncbi:MAG: tRNA lysidine(34) synthetase TilS [Bacteroides sp.]
MEHRIAQYIHQEKLFNAEDKILVALSGGADSVALLRLLLSMGYTCEAAHCNFHLRGEESDRDETFVRELCQQLGIYLHITHFQTEAYAAAHHLSIEMAARELRYAWFARTKESSGAAVIAVAHHQDDSVETLLLNLIRGTGINGLLGIGARNGDVVRPLLCINRQEITDYLQSIGQAYVTDSTNLQDEYTRNKIRLNLLPLMQEINPSVKESILDTARHLSQAACIYHHGIEEGKKRVLTTKGICIAALQNEPSPAALLFEIVHPLGFNSAQSKDLLASLEGQSGKQFQSKAWRIIKDREWLLIEKQKKETDESLPPFKLVKEVMAYTPHFIIPREKDVACFDAGKLNGTLSLRKWQAGDTFVPFGMKGSKRVSDYLTDRKFSLAQKEHQWVLCCNTQIAWLVGERTDNRFRVDEETKSVVCFSVIISSPSASSPLQWSAPTAEERTK